jgi:hypothetical protein
LLLDSLGVTVGDLVGDHGDISRGSQPPKVRRPHLDVHAIRQLDRLAVPVCHELPKDRVLLERRRGVVQSNLGLALIRRDQQQHMQS